MTNVNRRIPLTITTETAEAWRLLCDDLFGEDADAIALELTQLPLGVANTPVGNLIEDMAGTERAVFEFEVCQRGAELAAEESARRQNEGHPSLMPLASTMRADSTGEVANSPPLVGATFPESAHRDVYRPSSASPSVRPTWPVVQLVDLFCAPAGRGLQQGAAARHKSEIPQGEWKTSFSLVWMQDEITWALEGRKKGKSSVVVLVCVSESTIAPTSIDWMIPRTGGDSANIARRAGRKYLRCPTWLGIRG